MKLYMLIAEGIWLLGGLVIAAFILAVLAEAIVMFFFRLNKFGRCVVDSLMANIGSLLLGFLLFLIFNKSEFDISESTELIFLYFIVSIFEAWILKLLNTQANWGRILAASFVMNLVSFGTACLLWVSGISI